MTAASYPRRVTEKTLMSDEEQRVWEKRMAVVGITVVTTSASSTVTLLRKRRPPEEPPDEGTA